MTFPTKWPAGLSLPEPCKACGITPALQARGSAKGRAVVYYISHECVTSLSENPVAAVRSWNASNKEADKAKAKLLERIEQLEQENRELQEEEDEGW